MAVTDRDDSNYLGELFLIGQNKTPFFNMMGGLNGGVRSASFNFPVAQPWSLASASQDTQSEATSITAGTATTTTRAQDYNVCQIMKKDVGVSFAKQSTVGELAGIQIEGDNPVRDELAFQKNAQLRQMALDIEYSFIQGAYVASSVTATNQTTRGMLAAVSTNEVAAATADLTKDMIDELIRTMSANGSEFNNMVLFANALQVQRISNIYGYAPDSRTVGGVAIQTILLDIAGEVGVVYSPQNPTDDIFLADMSVVRPAFLPYMGTTVAFWDTSRTAASEGGFFYTQVGLDYGPEEFHGKITNLSTS